ncbi:MAG: hypothetical protein ABSB19_09965 [Methylomonas sp.]
MAVLLTFYVNNIHLPHQLAFIVSMTLLIGVNLIDDYLGLSVKIRLIVQIISVLIMTELAGLKIDNLGNLFGLGQINLYGFSTVFTVFAVVGCINAFNMIDGMDGLAGSLALISISSFCFLAWLKGDNDIIAYSSIYIAAILGFLMFNLRIFGRTSAKIFLGDNGSIQFGFLVSWLAIISTQGGHVLASPSYILWLVALPLFDSVCIMLRRYLKGRSPLSADREHLHHVFGVAGYSNNLSLSLLVIIAFILSLIGIYGALYFDNIEPVLFIFFLVLFAFHFWMMSRAWLIMKIARYLNYIDRRSGTITDYAEEKRSQSDRRFTPSDYQVQFFFNKPRYKFLRWILKI